MASCTVQTHEVTLVRVLLASFFYILLSIQKFLSSFHWNFIKTNTMITRPEKDRVKTDRLEDLWGGGGVQTKDITDPNYICVCVCVCNFTLQWDLEEPEEVCQNHLDPSTSTCPLCLSPIRTFQRTNILFSMIHISKCFMNDLEWCSYADRCSPAVQYHVFVFNAPVSAMDMISPPHCFALSKSPFAILQTQTFSGWHMQNKSYTTTNIWLFSQRYRAQLLCTALTSI